MTKKNKNFSNKLFLLTLNNRKIFATIIETTLNDAPITPATGLCFTKVGALPFSHLYSDISCNEIKIQKDGKLLFLVFFFINIEKCLKNIY